ncbi:MAG: hypothetical protein VKS61_00550 [Candidatus Sericytochromatia bacterium]|nr:hypothetical protein [Candidatus Sericytochromatia bacterium]
MTVTVLLAFWLMGEAGFEAWRMTHGGGNPSPMHRWFVSHAASHVGPAGVTAAGVGDSPLLAPIGHCENQLQAYKDAKAYAIFTRHSVTGDNVPLRMAVNCLHVVGAVSAIALFVLVMLSGGTRSTHPINRLASRTLLTTMYTMFLTGAVMFTSQQVGDLNYPLAVSSAHSGFPPPIKAENGWLALSFIGAFGLAFLNAACHFEIERGVPKPILIGQHVLSLLFGCAALGIFTYRLFVIPPLESPWPYMLELAALYSLYPLLDIANGYVLYKTGVKGMPHDWVQHRQDNLYVLIVLITTAVLLFVAADKHYFFNQQLPVAYRIGLELVPMTIWLASGRMVGWLKRSFAGAGAPANAPRAA